MKVPLGSWMIKHENPSESLTKPKTQGGGYVGERDSRNLTKIAQILLALDQAEGDFQSAGFSQALAWAYSN